VGLNELTGSTTHPVALTPGRAPPRHLSGRWPCSWWQDWEKW